MTEVAAIYGFEFTCPFDAGGLRFTPVSSDHATSKRLARALNSYHLTGTISAPDLVGEQMFNLEGILSFIEHLDVRVSAVVKDEKAIASPLDFFEATAMGGPRHNGGGAVVMTDTFSRASRPQFIDLALAKLADDAFCQRTKFKSLFFKAVEVFRQRRPFLEISYFLLVSGLEAFARASANDYTSSAAAVVTKVLSGYGLEVYETRPAELARAMSTYFHIRNALFHQGEFSKTVKINSDDVTLNSSEYFFHLSMLVTLTCMKTIGFDDGLTNWNCWIDSQMH